MSTKTFGLVIALAAFVLPQLASANSVTVKNKDGKKVVLVVKRSNSSMEVDVAARATMDLPGAPMTLTNKKTKEKIEAVSGETVVIEKGKLSKLVPPPEEGEEVPPPPAEESTPDAAPAPTAEATPAPTE